MEHRVHVLEVLYCHGCVSAATRDVWGFLQVIYGACNGSTPISQDLLNTELMPPNGRETTDALIGLPVYLLRTGVCGAVIKGAVDEI